MLEGERTAPEGRESRAERGDGYRPPHGGYPGVLLRRGACHFCDLPIGGEEKAVESNNTPGVWAHVTCWYDGGPFEREVRASDETAP